MEMKKYLMGPSGGTAASMGAFMEHFVKKSEEDEEIHLVPEMWRTLCGISTRSLIVANKEFVSGWSKMGGSPIIPSCKDTNVFKIKQPDGTTVDMSYAVHAFCRNFNGTIAIGGGGTTAQSLALHKEYGLNFIVPLATMDNDVLCFDNVLGFETASQNAGASIAACYNDAHTMQRPTMIFCMGYDCGRLSVNATKHAMTKYGAEIDMLHIPETQTSVEDVAAQINAKYKGGAFTIVISEGCCKSSEVTEGTHKSYSTAEYANEIMRLTGIKFKVLIPDYMQRSGNPVEEDIELAKEFSYKTFELIDLGQWNHVIGSRDGEIIAMPFEEVMKVLETQNVSSDWYATSKVSLDGVSDILVK
ncbi:MAG: 6-phosphofructokinase [Clostridia bacterium]|nr:6-phosphofructokinase [Clostridia bacterium]